MACEAESGSQEKGEGSRVGVKQRELLALGVDDPESARHFAQRCPTECLHDGLVEESRHRDQDQDFSILERDRIPDTHRDERNEDQTASESTIPKGPIVEHINP